MQAPLGKALSNLGQGVVGRDWEGKGAEPRPTPPLTPGGVHSFGHRPMAKAQIIQHSTEKEQSWRTHKIWLQDLLKNYSDLASLALVDV